MNILYFAWVRQKVGKSEEDVVLPSGVSTVSDLLALLRDRGGGYSEAFADPSRVHAAVNHQHVRFDAKLGNDDEVAFFPPVTGG
jgi:molybdopterin synthase sulfur carrier subunit